MSDLTIELDLQLKISQCIVEKMLVFMSENVNLNLHFKNCHLIGQNNNERIYLIEMSKIIYLMYSRKGYDIPDNGTHTLHLWFREQDLDKIKDYILSLRQLNQNPTDPIELEKLNKLNKLEESIDKYKKWNEDTYFKSDCLQYSSYFNFNLLMGKEVINS
jgi:hypothetical protein